VKRNELLSTLNILSVLIMTIFILSCMGSGSHIMRKDPNHKDNIPEGAVSPIDGLWTDGYYLQRIEKGRMYYAKEDKDKWRAYGMDLYWPSVTTRDIVRVGPGRYRAISYDNLPWTLTVVSTDKIVAKSKGKVVQLYTRVKLDDEKWFLSDLKLASQETPQKGKRLGSAPTSKQRRQADRANYPLITIHRVSIDPVVVPQGQPFDLIVSYMVQDLSTNQNTLPITFGYKVRGGDRTIFESKPKVAVSPNGRSAERVVHLEGSIQNGLYTVEVSLVYGGIRKTERVELRITGRQ
jgi:hypothetical protein